MTQLKFLIKFDRGIEHSNDSYDVINRAQKNFFPGPANSLGGHVRKISCRMIFDTKPLIM